MRVQRARRNVRAGQLGRVRAMRRDRQGQGRGRHVSVLGVRSDRLARSRLISPDSPSSGMAAPESLLMRIPALAVLLSIALLAGCDRGGRYQLAAGPND